MENDFRIFINEIKNFLLQNESLIKWKNSERNKEISEQFNKNKIILKELEQIDFKEPLSLLNPLYKSEKYNIELFSNEIENILNKKNKEKILEILYEKRENLELKKKIINYYLNYIIKNKFDNILNFLNLNSYLKELSNNAYNLINKNKKTIILLKNTFLLNSSKIILLKNKISNLIKLKNILSTQILKYYYEVKNLKLKDNSYLTFYKENILLHNNISSIIDDYPSLKIIYILSEKLQKKNDKFVLKFTYDIDHFFDEKKSNFYELFCLYNITNGVNDKNIMDFVNRMRINFKEKSKKIILFNLYNFSEDKENINLESLKKISEFQKLTFDENKFTNGIKNLLINLNDLIDIFINYLNFKEKSEWAEKLKSEIKKNKNIFFDIIDKHLSKIINYMNNIIKDFSSKKNIILIFSYFCVFFEISKKKFNLNYSKLFSLSLKNLVNEHIKNENLRNINKLNILLSGDLWEKTDIESENNFFSIEKIEEKVSIKYKKFLITLNNNKNINNDDLDNFYNEIFLDENLNENEEENNNIILLSKPLNLDSLILTQSSVSLIREIFDLIINFIFFENLTFENFIELFNLFDYYIYATINMFITNKTYFNSLTTNIEIEDIKKNEKFEYGSEITSYQEKYSNFRKFYINFNQKLNTIFNNNEVNLPILSEEINRNKNNKFDNSNFYEIMLLINSFHSIYKIIKRLKHFCDKIELDFQKNFIIENIEKYKLLINELRYFFYMKITSEIFSLDVIKNKILDYDFNKKENEAEVNLFDPNEYVSDILYQLKYNYEKIETKLLLFNKKQQEELIIIFIKFIIGNIQDSYSKIKKCSNTGRSIMLKDLKFIKQGIEDFVKRKNYNIDVDEYFNNIFTYLNSWYNKKDELFNYIFENKIQYKYFLGIFNTSPTINELSRRNKKDFIQKVNNKYLKLFEDILDNLNEE